MNLPAWVDDYRGLPFRRAADGPAAFDCYGLVCNVLRRRWNAAPPSLDAVHLEDANGRLRAALDAEGSAWREVAVTDPVPGDVLAFLPEVPPAELHVGIVVATGWMLHARQGRGVQTARYDREPWALWRVGGVFRLADRQEPSLRA